MPSYLDCTAPCRHCEKPFRLRTDRIGKQFYCSRQCKGKDYTVDLDHRFKQLTDRSGHCWLWLGHKIKAGYGHIQIESKMLLAHRASYSFYVGEIPSGMFVCHKCDNPSCVRPDHLFLGTHKDNMRDREEKGRGNQPKGENNGSSKLTESQVLEMRELRDTKKMSIAKIAAAFGMSQYATRAALRKDTWKHV